MAASGRKLTDNLVLWMFLAFGMGIIFCFAFVKLRPEAVSLVPLQEMETTVVDLTKTAEKCAKDLHQKNAALAKVEGELKDKQKQLEEKSKAFDSVKKELDEKKASFDSLTAEKSNMEITLKNTSEERDQLKNDLEELRKKTEPQKSEEKKQETGQNPPEQTQQ